MKKLLIALLIVSISGVTYAVSLYPSATVCQDVSAGKKIRAVWGVIVWDYYHGGLGAEYVEKTVVAAAMDPTVAAAIDPLTLSWTSTAAWPNVSEMQDYFHARPESYECLKQKFLHMKARVEAELTKQSNPPSSYESDWED